MPLILLLLSSKFDVRRTILKISVGRDVLFRSMLSSSTVEVMLVRRPSCVGSDPENWFHDHGILTVAVSSPSWFRSIIPLHQKKMMMMMMKKKKKKKILNEPCANKTHEERN